MQLTILPLLSWLKIIFKWVFEEVHSLKINFLKIIVWMWLRDLYMHLHLRTGFLF